MSVNIRYTRAELISLAPKPHEYTLASGVLQKFDVIEEEHLFADVAVPELQRAEAVGRKGGEGKGGAGSRRAPNNERFAPPTRAWRGSRDQEAFEEGYKYELERNAIKKQALQETMAKEQEKNDAAASFNEESKDEKKQQTSSTAKEESKFHEDEEIERLMTSIARGDEGARKVTKSRFFSGAESGSQAAAASSLGEGHCFSGFSSTLPVGGVSVQDQWSLHGMMSTSDVVWNNPDSNSPSGLPPTPATNSVDTATATSTAASHGVAVGSLQSFLPLGVTAQGAQQPSLSLPTMLPSASTAATASVSQSPNKMSNSQVRAWNAQDLEQILLSGQKVSKQPTVEVPKNKPIDAAALESQLLLQVQQKMARSQPQAQPPQPEQQQPPMSMPPQGSGAPQAILVSGARTSPHISSLQPPQHIPQQQQPVPVSWAVTMPKVPPQQLQKKLMQPQPQQSHRHPGLSQPMPIIMGGVQGATYYAQQPIQSHYVAGFVPGQGQQPMMLYRSPDGTTQYAMGAAKFPPGAQLIFSQPQQQQPQPQRR